MLAVIAVLIVLITRSRAVSQHKAMVEEGQDPGPLEPFAKSKLIVPVLAAIIIGGGVGAFTSYQVDVNMRSQVFKNCLVDTLMNDQRFSSLNYALEEAEHRANEIYKTFELHGEELAMRVMQRISPALMETECTFVQNEE